MRLWELEIIDLWLILEGYSDDIMIQQAIARKQTELICEVINRTWGGKGVMQEIRESWPLGGETKTEVDSEKIKRILALHKPFRNKPIKVGRVKDKN